MAITTYAQKASASDSVEAGSFVFDTVSGVGDVAISKMAFGAIGSVAYVSSSAGLPVAQQGTWTVELGSTDNAVLDAIAASVAASATAAAQTTANGLLTTIDADTGTIATHAATLAGAVSGTEVQVDVLTMPTVAVTGTFWQATQPVSGTVTANIGTVGTLATESTLGTLSAKFASGTVIGDVNLGATDNAVLDAIAASVAAIDAGQLADGHNVTVDNASIAVTGTFWQATQPVSLASVPSHAVTNAGTFAVQSTLQAGTAYAGMVRLTDGTTNAEVVPLTGYNAQAVAIVDGDGNQLTSFGGGTQYTEDSAAAANPVGNAQILVRADTPAGVATTDGDNVAMRGSNYGAAYVTLVDNAGSFVSVGGGTQYDEDSAHVSGDKVTMAGVVRADTAAALSATDGDRTCLITDASGRLHVNVGNTVTVGSHAVTNAGTFATQVDGAALTALQLIDDAIVTDGGAAGKYIALAAYDDGDTGLMQRLHMDNTNGGLYVSIAGQSAQLTTHGYAAADASLGAGQPVATGGYASATAPADVSSAGDAVWSWHLLNGAQAINQTFAGVLATTGNGASGTGVQRVTIANDSTGIVGLAAGTNAIGKLTSNTGVTIGAVEIAAAQTLATVTTVGTVTTCSTLTNITNWGNIVDDAAFTPGTTRVLMAGFEADEASIDSVDEGDGGAARMTLDRKIITTPQPHTQGGLSIFRSLDLDETEEDVKTSAGQIYGGFITNTSTGTRWIKFYNATAANVTVGSTTPVITWGIQGGATDDVAAILNTGGMGIAFDTAISVAATTGFGDSDTGAPGANDVIINLFYK